MGDDKRQPNEKLRRARELRGWSQRYVARQVGTTEHVVSRWESGQHKPNRYFQTELCKLFDMNAEELGFMSAYEQKEKLPQPYSSFQLKAPQSSLFGQFLIPPSLPDVMQNRTLPKHIIENHGKDFSLSPRIFLDSGLLDRFKRAFTPHSKIDLSALDYLQLASLELKKQFVRGKETNWSGLLTAASNQLLFLIGLDAPQEACNFVIRALTFVQQTGSTRAFQRILLIQQALRRWDDLPEVRKLDEQISLFIEERV